LLSYEHGICDPGDIISVGRGSNGLYLVKSVQLSPRSGSAHGAHECLTSSVVGCVIYAPLIPRGDGERGTEMPRVPHRVLAVGDRSEALTIGHHFLLVKIDILATRRIAVTVAPILKHEGLSGCGLYIEVETDR
jgi:hypothetical protein